MLNAPQIKKMLGKLERFQSTLYNMIFVKVAEMDFDFFETSDSLTAIPTDGFKAVARGEKWGAEGKYGWFKGSFTVPQELAGKQIFLMPHIGCYEGLLFVDGKARGCIANKIQVQYTEHGNHFCDMVADCAAPGDVLDIVLELYCGHFNPGNHPFSKPQKTDFTYEYGGADICVKDYEVQEMYFDLNAVLQLAEVLPENSFRRGRVIECLYRVHNALYYDADNIDRETFLDSIRSVMPYIKEILSHKSADSAPFAGITGHSHMDTAWLWHIGETVKKCARTYSNALNLMEQYPEYRFIQSSSCHSDFIRRYYPELFERIREKVAEGRYEPNGGVWVECDCNITSGESMVRQFLWGQRFTRKYFGYTSDVFWLPDTFGYSASIPQIMRGCGCKYFMTTKISWNDTNKFPYDTFKWQGIDGSEVLAHFNTTHHYPNVEDMYSNFNEGIAQPDVTNMKYMAYGFGDGGGGPTFEMIESAKRCVDLEGLGKSENMSASDFMARLEKTAENMNTYKGELYLELHRGTLTNQHTIKRNNRKSEIALHNLEFVTVCKAAADGKTAEHDKIDPLYETLLINQFHDILPGTCINRAHEESRKATTGLIVKADELIKTVTDSDGGGVTLINTLSFERNDPLFISADENRMVSGCYPQQLYTDLDGNKKLIVGGVKIPAMSCVHLDFEEGSPSETTFAEITDGGIETPFARVKFGKNGGFSSFFDKRARRELRCGGYDLNTFIMAEDVPCSWDNWDVDADIAGKFKDVSVLVSSETVSSGAVAHIIRNKYKISDKSMLVQDVMFFADRAEVRFDTLMDWNEEHRLLKTCFDTDIKEDFARQEIQFGYVKRPTTRNTSVEQAKFEVLNHKYTDLSESRFGVSILNDSKYGMTLNGSRLALSLHKGGVRPDFKGDKDGIHRTVYSFLPHIGGFSSENVIRPAYELNYPPIEAKGVFNITAPAVCDSDNIIIETVKPCEDAEKAYIIRMYEAEGTFTNAVIGLPENTDGFVFTDMLEEPIADRLQTREVNTSFRPFEIKTMKIFYR